MAAAPFPQIVHGENAEHVSGLVLHHIGIVVADVLRAGHEYKSMFGYEVCSEVFHDPVQTAYVRFLRIKGDPVYLEIVSPDGSGSKLANALRKGGGLNHLCFATDDIVKSWASLRAQGLFPLQRPVAAVAFGGRRIAWFMGKDRIPIEVVERGTPGQI